jgi:hypothetical protein
MFSFQKINYDTWYKKQRWFTQHTALIVWPLFDEIISVTLRLNLCKITLRSIPDARCSSFPHIEITVWRDYFSSNANSILSKKKIAGFDIYSTVHFTSLYFTEARRVGWSARVFKLGPPCSLRDMTKCGRNAVLLYVLKSQIHELLY